MFAHIKSEFTVINLIQTFIYPKNVNSKTQKILLYSI